MHPEGRASKLVWLARPSGWVSESGLIPGVFAALKPPANCSDTFGVVSPARDLMDFKNPAIPAAVVVIWIVETIVH